MNQVDQPNLVSIGNNKKRTRLRCRTLSCSSALEKCVLERNDNLINEVIKIFKEDIIKQLIHIKLEIFDHITQVSGNVQKKIELEVDTILK